MKMFGIRCLLAPVVTRLTVFVVMQCACVLAYQTTPAMLICEICSESEGSEENRTDTTEEIDELHCQLRLTRVRLVGLGLDSQSIASHLLKFY